MRAWALGVALAACAAAPAGTAPEQVTSLKGWKSLTLKAGASALYTGSATLELAEGPHPHTGRAAIVLTTRSEARLLGAIGFEERSTSWIDAATRRPLELFQLRPGDVARRFRFEADGVRQTTWKPPEGNTGAPFEAWREQETTLRRPTFEDGSAVPEGEPLVDVYSLLYLLRDMDLSSPKAAAREFIVMQRRHAVRVVVTPLERRVQPREILDETSGGPRTVRLAERRLGLRAAGPGQAGVRGFLGLEGELEIWMEESGGALVEVRGNAPGVGATSLSLSSCRL
ncbi:MAG: hypothetical protein ACREAA_17690 [Candidatus Polarisedimenticolia bacterium]